jgi:isopropylmalate/homocitrate/citramalate synthase
VWTTETTHRDGQQGGLPLTLAQSLQIYDILCRLTGTSGAIRQAEFFVYHPSDRAALEGALERYRGGAPIEPTTWIRATAKDVALIRQLGVRETGMLASASDYHTFHKFKPGGRNQAAQTYLDAVQCTVEVGILPAFASGRRHTCPLGLYPTVCCCSTGDLRASRAASEIPYL